MDGFAVIQFGKGVSITLPVSVEPKHYSMEEAQSILETIARNLGGEFVYFSRGKEL